MSFRTWRWVAAGLQTIVFVGLPFLRLGGESALRFDVPSLKVYFFGSVYWAGEAFFFLLILLLFFIGIMLFTVLFGRIWCGWICPQTVLSDIARIIDKGTRISSHPALAFLLTQTGIFLVSALVSANLLCYFVPPSELFNDIRSLSHAPWTFGSWIFFTGMIYLDIAFVRQKFCAFICPYARFQSAFFDDKTLTISFDTSRQTDCRGCDACVRACPAGIDIRSGLQVECINCAQCIDACARQMAVFKKKSLIGYFLGLRITAAPARHRTRFIGLAALFALLATLFVYTIATRMPFDFWVLNTTEMASVDGNSGGGMMNRYALMIENRGLTAAEYHLAASGLNDAELVLAQNPFSVPGNSSQNMIVYIILRKAYTEPQSLPFLFVIQDRRKPESVMKHEARFMVMPEMLKGE